MYKLAIIFSFLILFSLNCSAQEKPQVTDSTKLLVDSIQAMVDSVVALLKSEGLYDKSSYAQVGVGAGNSLFSVHNNSLNAKQGSSTAVFMPSAGYYHKSGISLSAIGYLLKEKKMFGVNQYSVTPAYETGPDKKIDLLVSYTHYFIKNEYSNYSSPIQNDFYVSAIFKKPLIQPGLAFGYSFGEFKDVRRLDTTIAGIQKHFYDSATSKLNTTSLIVSVQHEFDWYSVFTKDDGIIFSPAVMLNFGQDNTTTNHNTNIGLGTIIGKRLNKLLTKRAARLQSTSFQAESVGLDLGMQYAVGIFSVEPHAYFDYYIPSDNGSNKKLTQVYTVNFYFTID